ncbi:MULTISPECIES: TetR/AcrR family transcriptional regulator [unclassified Enterococcus]|uniref:TetR/AcrR family transcriptional regulator n=1 Tax=unclassified Enterococcus TaxID=2608891 RepID=UPI001CE1D162|nr:MULTISPECIES: TetR/AcrR family transcriptional regulator [unclassified Enterococcus]MCA5012879.1 TetR/AcrR family transcriptional regulator [Enterococcus sp. S23]MCA5016130.1 TetR/AcrR family transcriptional regulator [Enterococcus sp. S22(2020)]
MVRKKVYKKQHILAAASDLLEKKSFSAITARNVAEHMGISTQPIYLEFKNMEDLKLTLLQTIYKSLEKDYFSTIQSDDFLINFVLNYIEFAKTKRNLFIVLFVEHHSYGQQINQLTLDLFTKSLKGDERYTAISPENLNKLFIKVWVIATGLASLSTSGIMNLKKEEIIAIFKNS